MLSAKWPSFCLGLVVLMYISINMFLLIDLLMYLVKWCISLRWRHNGRNGVWNHQPHHCLLNRLLRRRSKKTSKLCVTGLCVGDSPGPVNSPHKWPLTQKMFPFDDVTALLVLCAGNSPVTGEFPSQRSVTQSFDVFFDLRLNKRWVNNREAGVLRRHRAHYDVTVMCWTHTIRAHVLDYDDISWPWSWYLCCATCYMTRH